MKIISILFMLLVLSISVFANQDYNMTGNENNQFLTGIGDFNINRNPLEDVNVYAQGLTASRQTPLVSDLDGDGTNEIIVFDDDTVVLFQNKELDVVASFGVGSPDRISNIITYDIDGDGYREIIFVEEEAELLYILQWNGTDLINESTFNTIPSYAGSSTSGEIVIACRDTNQCMMAYASDIVSGFAGFPKYPSLYATKFNSSSISQSNTLLENLASGFSVHCMPTIRTMQVADYDQDGTNEYVFSALEVDNTFSADEELKIFFINVLDNGTVIKEMQVDETAVDSFLSASTKYSCDNSAGANTDGLLAGYFLSSPLVFDFKASSSGLETGIAFSVDENEYIMQLIESDGDTHLGDRFPQITEAEGVLISNVFLANAFTDSGTADLCVAGFNDDDVELQILCGSKRTAEIPETAKFQRTLDEGFNVSRTYATWNTITHAGQHSSAQTTETGATSDLSEIINTYGVNTFDWDGAVCEATGNCGLNRIFLNGGADSVLLSVDVEKFGSEDLLAMTDTNLFYFDDKQSNEPATITSVTYNPCIVDSTVKVNTTLQVTVVVTDQNPAVIGADDVIINVTTYKNDVINENEQNAVGVASGSSQQFTFTLNATGNNKILEILGRDTVNIDEIDSQEQRFNVNNIGVEFGDSTCTTDYVAIAEEEAEPTVGGDLNETSNVGTQTLGLMTGTGLGGFGNSILIMGFVAFLFIFSPKVFGKEIEKLEAKLLMLALILVEALLLLFFTAIGTIPVGVTISLVVIAITPIALWVRSFITGLNSGGMGG